MPMKREIIGRRERAELTPRGDFERVIVIEYMLDNLGPFVFECPAKQFTYDALGKDMETHEKGLAAVQGT